MASEERMVQPDVEKVQKEGAGEAIPQFQLLNRKHS